MTNINVCWCNSRAFKLFMLMWYLLKYHVHVTSRHSIVAVFPFISANYEDVINAAIKEWTQYTCLTFLPANNEIFELLGHTNYVLFRGVSDSQRYKLYPYSYSCVHLLRPCRWPYRRSTSDRIFHLNLHPHVRSFMFDNLIIIWIYTPSS